MYPPPTSVDDPMASKSASWGDEFTIQPDQLLQHQKGANVPAGTDVPPPANGTNYVTLIPDAPDHAKGEAKGEH